MTSSDYSLSVAVSREGFKLTRGTPVIGGLHGAIRHYFCAHCMTWMYTRPPGLNFVNVRSPLLDSAAQLAPFIETCTSEKLPWATTSATRSYPAFPPLNEYQQLIAAYAKHVA